MAKLGKTQRDARLDDVIDRVRAIQTRKRAELDALPPKASRSAAQKKTATETRDWQILARGFLLLTGAASDDDVAEGTGSE